MFMYTLYLEGKAIYKMIKAYKTCKDIVKEMEGLDWCEMMSKIDNEINNVVAEQ